MARSRKSLGFLFCAYLLATIGTLEEQVVQGFVPSNFVGKPGQRKSTHDDNNNNKGHGFGDEKHLAATTLNDNVANPSYIQTNATLEFPPFYNLMDVKPGDFVASQVFTCTAPKDPEEEQESSSCTTEHKFRVKLYPKGGGGSGNEAPSKLSSILPSRTPEVVGLYLEYLGSSHSVSDSVSDSVNATFALRLKGQQQERRFDVEWRAGMRFVSDFQEANLNQGDAVEFGFPLMQTPLLKEFMGIRDNDDLFNPTPIQVQAEVLIHTNALEEDFVEFNNNRQTSLEPSSSSSTPFNEDIRQKTDGAGHDTERVRVGKIVVPVLSRFSQRPKLFAQGTYPGVEYRILRILKDGQERFTSCQGAEYELKPVYPLVAQLERQWPVRVNEESIPRLYTPSMYNTLSAVGSFFTALTGLFTAFLVSQAISFFFIPSKSMDPTMQVGDVLLVDKVSSRIPIGKSSRNKVGDIVLFSPPSELQQIVSRSGGNVSSRDLFVKRIAAVPGDKVTVFKDGNVEVNDKNVVDGQRDLCAAEPLRLIEKYIEPSQDQVIKQKEVFVMGDCSSVSVDSRVWGPLETENIVGRPIIRLWPFDRFGKVE